MQNIRNAMSDKAFKCANVAEISDTVRRISLMKLCAVRALVLLVGMFGYGSTHSQTPQFSGVFKISSIHVSGAGNMYFRVGGMPTFSACAAGPDWAYVDEGDSGAKAKIAALLSAYQAGKRVNLVISPNNYYNNGNMYCHIIEFDIIE